MTSDFRDRMIAVMQEKEISQADICRKTGASRGTVSKWIAGTNMPGSEFLLKLSEGFGISSEWLINGTGEKYIRKPAANNNDVPNFGVPFLYTEEWDDDTPLDDDEVEVIFFKDFHFSAGNGSFDEAVKENEKRRLRIGKYTLRNVGVSAKECYVFTVEGDSMSPEIKNGSTVWVDVGRKNIKDGKIYAINHGGAFRVKRLYKLPMCGVRIVSDNEDKDLYPTEELTAEQIKEQHFEVIGWVWNWAYMDRW